jgi:hypothetical protein
VRPPVQWDDSGIVNHLVEHHHVVARLDELHVLVVPAGRHGWPRVVSKEAALGSVTVLRPVGGPPQSFPVGLRALLRFRRQRRHAPVGGIDDESGPLVRAD